MKESEVTTPRNAPSAEAKRCGSVRCRIRSVDSETGGADATSITIVVRLVRSVLRHADVLRLLFGQFRQSRTYALEM